MTEDLFCEDIFPVCHSVTMEGTSVRTGKTSRIQKLLKPTIHRSRLTQLRSHIAWRSGARRGTKRLDHLDLQMQGLVAVPLFELLVKRLEEQHIPTVQLEQQLELPVMQARQLIENPRQRCCHPPLPT